MTFFVAMLAFDIAPLAFLLFLGVGDEGFIFALLAS